MNVLLSSVSALPGVPSFETNDADECRDYIRENTGTHNFSVARPSDALQFSHYACSIGRMSLHVCDLLCPDGFTVTKAGPASYYSFQFLLEGHCEFVGRFGSVVANPGDVFIIDPDQITKEIWPGRCLQLLLRVDRSLVEQTLATELGKTLRHRPTFDPVGKDPGIRRWLQNIAESRFSGQSDALLDNRRVSRSIEHSLTTMLLAGLHHSATDDFIRVGGGVAPYYVKRAEDYIHECARDEVTVEEIAAAAGVSARTLFYGFKRWRSKTPMAYLRDLRLEIARKELERSQRAGGTVSQAALSAGFNNLSQFSRIYKARFGETPSATLLAN